MESEGMGPGEPQLPELDPIPDPVELPAGETSAPETDEPIQELNP
jgi:hypothetical protein